MGQALKRISLCVLVLFSLAPTAGDIGGCGQEPALLDEVKFFNQKQIIDCNRCIECGVSTQACARACGPLADEPAFPDGCFPLVHDGEVCLNALLAASCDDYASYMDDVAPTAPTECNFCPLDEQPTPESAP